MLRGPLDSVMRSRVMQSFAVALPARRRLPEVELGDVVVESVLSREAIATFEAFTTNTVNYDIYEGLPDTAVTNNAGELLGVFTDGDLRRAVDDSDIDLRDTPVARLMTSNPKTITADKLAVEAAQVMEAHKIHALLVVNEQNHLVGALNIHDLLRARVV